MTVIFDTANNQITTTAFDEKTIPVLTPFKSGSIDTAFQENIKLLLQHNTNAFKILGDIANATPTANDETLSTFPVIDKDEALIKIMAGTSELEIPQGIENPREFSQKLIMAINHDYNDYIMAADLKDRLNRFATSIYGANVVKCKLKSKQATPGPKSKKKSSFVVTTDGLTQSFKEGKKRPEVQKNTKYFKRQAVLHALLAGIPPEMRDPSSKATKTGDLDVFGELPFDPSHDSGRHNKRFFVDNFSDKDQSISTTFNRVSIRPPKVKDRKSSLSKKNKYHDINIRELDQCLEESLGDSAYTRLSTNYVSQDREAVVTNFDFEEVYESLFDAEAELNLNKDNRADRIYASNITQAAYLLALAKQLQNLSVVDDSCSLSDLLSQEIGINSTGRVVSWDTRGKPLSEIVKTKFLQWSDQHEHEDGPIYPQPPEGFTTEDEVKLEKGSTAKEVTDPLGHKQAAFYTAKSKKQKGEDRFNVLILPSAYHFAKRVNYTGSTKFSDDSLPSLQSEARIYIRGRHITSSDFLTGSGPAKDLVMKMKIAFHGREMKALINKSDNLSGRDLGNKKFYSKREKLKKLADLQSMEDKIFTEDNDHNEEQTTTFVLLANLKLQNISKVKEFYLDPQVSILDKQDRIDQCQMLESFYIILIQASIKNPGLSEEMLGENFNKILKHINHLNYDNPIKTQSIDSIDFEGLTNADTLITAVYDALGMTFHRGEEVEDFQQIVCNDLQTEKLVNPGTTYELVSLSSDFGGGRRPADEHIIEDEEVVGAEIGGAVRRSGSTLRRDTAADSLRSGQPLGRGKSVARVDTAAASLGAGVGSGQGNPPFKGSLPSTWPPTPTGKTAVTLRTGQDGEVAIRLPITPLGLSKSTVGRVYGTPSSVEAGGGRSESTVVDGAPSSVEADGGRSESTVVDGATSSLGADDGLSESEEVDLSTSSDTGSEFGDLMAEDTKAAMKRSMANLARQPSSSTDGKTATNPFAGKPKVIGTFNL